VNFRLPEINDLLEHYSSLDEVGNCFSERTLVHSWNRLEVHYAPFNHQKRESKLILLGITPGKSQTINAWRNAVSLFKEGKDAESCIRWAKKNARFAGGMRANLVNMLDAIGVPEKLGTHSMSNLFDNDSELLYSGSIVRYPVLKDGENYSGSSPKLHKDIILCQMFQEWTLPVLNELPNSLIVPLGKSVQELLIQEGFENRMLVGFPHPSPGNGHRNKQFQSNRDSMIETVNEWNP